MRRKALKTILVVTVIAIAHFAASFYVSHKIGTIAGTLVSETLINASEVNEISADVTDQMSQELKETSGSWIKMSYVLAFPVGLFTIPLKDNLMQQHILKPIIEETLSPEQIETRLWVFGTFGMLLNSVVMALCITGVWAFIKKNVLRTEHANAADRCATA